MSNVRCPKCNNVITIFAKSKIDPEIYTGKCSDRHYWNLRKDTGEEFKVIDYRKKSNDQSLSDFEKKDKRGKKDE